MAIMSGQQPTNFTDENSSDMDGLSKAIYDIMKPIFVTPMIQEVMKNLNDAKVSEKIKNESKINIVKYHKMLCYIMAKGVVDYLLENLEVRNIRSRITNQQTGEIEQINPGTGLIR